MSILKNICEHQRVLTQSQKKLVSLEELKEKEAYHAPIRSLRKKFETSSNPGVIAEFKRRSPSKPQISLDAEVAQILPMYEEAGVYASSILTNAEFFGGSDHDLLEARRLVNIPLLRKDFMVDPYQIHETKSLGADILLLIAAALDPIQCAEYAALAKEVGLEVLLELKDPTELVYVGPNIDFVGVNNRNLLDFKVDLAMSRDLIEQIPSHCIKISESGIDDPVVAKQLFDLGYRGFLIGEFFMRNPNPGLACSQFIQALNQA